MFDGAEKKLEDILKVRCTTSYNARFKRAENKMDYDPKAKEDEDVDLDLLDLDPAPRDPDGPPEYIYVKFGDRSFGSKCARMNYVFWRIFVASFWYYFIPFISIYLSYVIPFMCNEDVELNNDEVAPEV